MDIKKARQVLRGYGLILYAGMVADKLIGIPSTKEEIKARQDVIKAKIILTKE
jgi:hypothetical protein